MKSLQNSKTTPEICFTAIPAPAKNRQKLSNNLKYKDYLFQAQIPAHEETTAVKNFFRRLEPVLPNLYVNKTSK